MSMKGCSLLLLSFVISGTVSLKCYQCSEAQDKNECNSIEYCSEGQVCYKERQFTNRVQIDLGCVDKKKCGEYANIQNASDISKLSADQISYCYECCAKDRCNKDLCEYPPHSLCKDDETVDCAKWNSMFSICKVTSEAKKICPKYCNLCSLVDGKWSPWSPWSSCDVTCGKGSFSRHRLCNNPAPQNGGLDCPGKGTERQACTLKLCPVHGGWSLWGEWGQCSASCGIGMTRRNRSCTNPRPRRYGNHCFGESAGYEICNSGFCAGVWSDWQAWGNCSSDCGKGIQTRERICSKNLFTGDCEGNSRNDRTCERTKCTDCYDIGKRPGTLKSGVYNVTLWKSKKTISVYCDFDTDNGGWTVFQHRFNGSVDFYRNFSEYRTGFGSLNGEFWLGLEYIYEMVSQGESELRLDLTAANGKNAHQTFQNFSISQGPRFSLRIDKGVGITGNPFFGLEYNNGSSFSTYDFDQDDSRNECATVMHGAWWYKSCSYVNLNGIYGRTSLQSMFYQLFQGRSSLKSCRMMFRKIQLSKSNIG